MNPDIEFPRAERLDAEAKARAVSEQTGIRLTVEGPCAGGQVGAAYVRWPDGRRAVLKWRPNYTVAELEAGPLAVTERLRELGYPAPAMELATQVGGAVVTVQELLPGRKIDNLDLHLLERVLAVHSRQADALAGRDDVPSFHLYLRDDGPGYCLHEPLRRFSARTAELERRISRLADAHPTRLPGYGAVHSDLHPGNILAADGEVTGVVDWDGSARGDHRFDLVVLRFGVHPKGSERGVVERLDGLLDALPEAILQPAWAHMSLRMTDWAIRHFPPEEVDDWVDLAEQRLEQ
ncbi:phosphotransferase enzyme family protein [Actinospica robiniae]|uniref:phosphotransferase enzyme family protein n=1 Tax=Actinospica robiniae TaxID=304901 RepID=UPI0003F8D86E|nr:aminoglycoside phosphotransferase family protein [Actinospica robiniae]